ncbi:MAG: hypothetical protein EOP52_08325 [Sphingobacteriales bacterium]|jgi:hypothetical protein|nr:MAG: hypothetical protein EOP52_08325 [Sphingobacteriales bacterium]
MKKITLLLSGLMIAFGSYAGDGNKGGCCAGKKEACAKEKKEACAKGKGCCKKGTETAKADVKKK